MSLVFGGKLLAPKSCDEGDEKSNPAFGLRHLSKREKQLMDELSRTRSEILSELMVLGPSATEADMDLWQKTVDEYQSPIVTRFPSTKGNRAGVTKKIGRGKYRLHQDNNSMAATYGERGGIKTTLDALPILSASGTRSTIKKGKVETIQLPVVSLPAVGSSSMSHTRMSSYRSCEGLKGSKRGTLSRDSQSSEVTVTYSQLFADISEGLSFIRKYFCVSNADVRDIQLYADKILSYVDKESSVEFFPNDDVSTVFMSVRCAEVSTNEAVTVAEGSGNGIFPRFSIGHSDVQDSGGFLTSSMSLSDHIGSTKHDRRHRSLQFGDSSRKKNSATKNRLNLSGPLNYSNAKLAKKKSRVAWASLEISQDERLRGELLASIGNMQKHTHEVKQGILGVQELVALSNPKARSFVMSIAADHLCATLTRLGQRELRRGWDAWTLCIRNQTLREKVILIRSFVRLRKICSLLGAMAHRVLRKNFVHWVKFSVFERLRVEMEIKTAAAVLIQRIARGVIGRVKARQAAEGHKFLQMHKSLVKLQSLFRCKLQRWKYQKYMRETLEESSCELIQRIARGFIHRRRVRKIRMYKDKESAAITIQAAARGMKGRKKASEVRLFLLKNKVIVKIQALARGYIGRSRVEKILQDKLEAAAAIKIQARIRGAVTRMNLHHRRREVEEFRSERSRMVTAIQAAYRGFRARVMVRYYMEERNKLRDHQSACALKIQCLVRSFLARSRILNLRADRMDEWIANASKWKEMWAEDSATWFYINEATQEALWEPPAEGYTKNDGQLVLENGKIIDKPDNTNKKKKRSAGEEHLCVECATRVAIRSCNECGDNFCTKCYKELHASGSRKQHTYQATGPLDCTECEEQLAERWCISCDEAYCDACWRKVHSKGKRRYHPFSQVLETGHVDNRIFTIDGEQVHNYDASYSQNRYEEDNAAVIDPELHWNQSEYEGYEGEVFGEGYIAENSGGHDYDEPVESYGYDPSSDDVPIEYAEGVSTGDEWVQYYDENEYPYWYNSVTGESSYEDPYSS